MKNFFQNLCLLLMFAFFCSACDVPQAEEETQDPPLEFQEESEDVKDIIAEATPAPPTTHVLFENQKVGKETFVGSVSEGDVVKIQFAGLEKEDRFRSYSKKFTSTWQEKICWKESIDLGMGAPKFVTQCGEEKKKGVCKVYYKKHLGKRETPLEFKESPKDIPLRFRLGGNVYPVGDIEKHGGHYIEASLKMEKGMLQWGSNELYILPLHEAKDLVKTGFRYRSNFDCAGRGKKDFRFSGPTSSSTVPHEVLREFYVDLQIVKQNPQPKGGANPTNPAKPTTKED